MLTAMKVVSYSGAVIFTAVAAPTRLVAMADAPSKTQPTQYEISNQ